MSCTASMEFHRLTFAQNVKRQLENRRIKESRLGVKWDPKVQNFVVDIFPQSPLDRPPKFL